MTARSWTLNLIAPAKWLNENDRHKRRPDRIIACWRSLAAAIATHEKVPKLKACTIEATLRWPDNRRRDSGNFFPTVKAAVDGIVDAGVLDDDSDRHVHRLSIERGSNVPRRSYGPQGVLTLTIREVA